MNSNVEETFSAQSDAVSLGRIAFVVDGVPVSAPRQVRRDAFAPTRHVQFYHAWKDLVRQAGIVARRNRAPYDGQQLWGGPVGLSAAFFMPVPPSWPAWKRRLAEEGALSHCSTPDLDNLLKAVKDALNGVLWEDDAQVCRYFEPLLKGCSANPRAEIKIYQLAGYASTLTTNPEPRG